MKELEKVLQISPSKEPQEKENSLHRAFKIFSEQALRLEHVYNSLNKQFESLNLELQDANHELHVKVAELDVLTDYLKNILENISQGILFIGLDGVVTTCNKAAETILGIPSRELIFRKFQDNFKNDVFAFPMHEALHQQKKEEASYSVTYTSPTGRESELEITTAFVHTTNNQNASSQNQGMIVVIRDVTEMRHLQIMAARADRMKILGIVAAEVAHEIRNPLGGIKGFASLLKRDLSENPRLQEMASHIVEGTDNLSSCVDQILHYARPLHLHLETTDIISLVKQVKQHLMADANIYRPNIEININAAEEEIYLPLDCPQFKSALLNLLVNAIQAMPNGGKISISIERQHPYVLINVSDTGTGIPEDLIPKLYSPFFTTKPDGNGLGLAEVQKVVQAHGGTIDVNSEINKGTTFTLKLPLKCS